MQFFIRTKQICLFSAALLMAPAVHEANAATVLVAPGGASSWRYLDAGRIAAQGWNTEAFDARQWKAGTAPLGYGDRGLTTTIAYGRLPEAKPITTYFRHVVDVPDPQRVAHLALDLRRDDGAVVYWNGVEILRDNLPVGPITPQTRAPHFVDGDMELEYRRYLLPVASLPLQAGANVLAVEIHQVAPNSSDMLFDLALTAYAPGENLPQDGYAAAFTALAAGRAEQAVDLLLSADPQRAGFAQLAVRAGEVFLAKGGSSRDPRYWQLLDRARGAAPDDLEIVYAWVRAHVAARKDLPIQPTARAWPAVVDERWRFIADTPAVAGGPVLTREQLLADVNDLELLLENCYSYLERNGADYRAALDALRASITGDLNATTFAHRVARMLTVFGDPHIGLAQAREPRVAARFVMDGEHVAVLKPDRSGLLDPQRPHVSAINGQPIDQWLAAAERIVAQASPQYRRHLALRQLRELGALARQLRLETASFELTLKSADGSDTARVPLALGDGGPPSPLWPPHRSEVRADGLGYLRIASMDQGPAFVNRLDDWMEKFSGTRGLIIDVRGNPGGTQDALQTLLPWLMRPGSPMRIVNVAAYRLPLALPTPNRSGFLGMDGRGLHPATSSVWTDAEAQQIRAFLAGWRPAWQLPAGKFSDWHVMAIRAEQGHGHYDRPVIVLQDVEDFSATDNFLGALKGLPNITLMGSASGGGSGRMAQYALPNSGLRLTLCQMASFATNGHTYDGNGVQPDVVVPPRLQDQIVGGGDSVLDAAVRRLLAAQPSK